MNSLASTSAALASQGVAYAPQIAAAAARHGLDPELLAAVAAQETGGPGANAGRNVVGDGGHGRGLFQIDDRWHSFAKTAAAMDPGRNANYAAGMLSGLLQRYGGNVKAALSAYNAGSPDATGTTTTWGDGKRLGYADSVLRHYSQLEKAPVSFNIGKFITGGLEGLVTGNPIAAVGGAIAGGFSGGAPSATDPSLLQNALCEQSSAFTNINTLASLAQSAPQSDKLLAGLIDGDDAQ
jgi:hypothetical protein